MKNPMTHTLKTTLKFATATAAFALLASAALAGDLSNGMPGGMKDGRGGAVPVPVPVPYEETFKYYVGGSVGWTFSSTGNMSIAADHQVVGQSHWIDSYSQLQGPHVLSLVAGRYITPSLRAELGIDYRSPQRPAKAKDVVSYNGSLTGTLTSGASQTNVYAMTRTEDVITQNHTFMLNAYYDLNREGRFKPYIGAGIGFSRRYVTRSSTESVGGCNTTLSTGGACTNDASFVAPTAFSSSSSEDVAGFGLAASAMAGLSYKIGDRTTWDLGYRMMYHGGKVAVAAPSLGGFSTLNIGDRFDHEIRTGLRFDVW